MLCFNILVNILNLKWLILFIISHIAILQEATLLIIIIRIPSWFNYLPIFIQNYSISYHSRILSSTDLNCWVLIQNSKSCKLSVWVNFPFINFTFTIDSLNYPFWFSTFLIILSYKSIINSIIILKFLVLCGNRVIVGTD